MKFVDQVKTRGRGKIASASDISLRRVCERRSHSHPSTVLWGGASPFSFLCLCVCLLCVCDEGQRPGGGLCPGLRGSAVTAAVVRESESKGRATHALNTALRLRLDVP